MKSRLWIVRTRGWAIPLLVVLIILLAIGVLATPGPFDGLKARQFGGSYPWPVRNQRDVIQRPLPATLRRGGTRERDGFLGEEITGCQFRLGLSGLH